MLHAVIPVKFDPSSEHHHIFYVKEHRVRDSNEEKPVGRTLFLLNVPMFCQEVSHKYLRALFEDSGEISNVYLQEKPSSGPAPNQESGCFQQPPLPGFKVAYVVFKVRKGLLKALNKKYKKPKCIAPKNDIIPLGVQKWCKQYNERLCGEEELEKEVNTFMEAFEKREAERIKQEREAASKPDEEGWITVSHRGRKPGAVRSEAFVKKIHEKEKVKRTRKELLNFYTFQIRESKMNEVARLKEKFEEDKKRIETMRKARKFKPF
ncbi:unnamed protein product [Darwinula stevensoni]|uniref:Uncharacterized protein n=1 Tax=Darwinula stevensoni TaxID=69355 RepID=A0A7R8XD91_9CRUS|nr:unnamed protein product [Darwinula stevensoni]CAG0888442.1 unnamed protein product [Darwinula stevensoni]